MDNYKIIFQIFLFILLFSMVSCGKNKQNSSLDNPDNLGQFISSHMPGSIHAKDAIRVRFANSVNNAVSYPSEVSSDLFKLTPSIAGTAVWENAHTFRFKPSKYFEPNKQYQIWFDKTKLFGEDASTMGQLKLGFGILPNQVSIEFNSPKPNQEGNGYSVDGNMVTGIPFEEEHVNKLFDIQFSGKKPIVKWEHAKNGLQHSFSIQPLERKEKEQKLVINWDGKTLKSNDKGERRFSIPARSEFKILDIDVQQEGGKKIAIHFSDILQKNKNIIGLVQLNGSDKKFTSEVIDNQIILYPNSTVTGNFNLSIKRGITNNEGRKLKKNAIFELTFEDVFPELKLAGQGVIIPNTEEVVFPFEYMNVKAVTVEIFEIFESNVLQFLQYTNLNDGWGLDPVGRIVKQERVELGWQNGHRNVWQRAGIDLSKITNISPGSIYQVRIGFNKSDSFIQCENDIVDPTNNSSNEELQTIMQYNYNYPGFDYSQVDDPCYPAYYTAQRYISSNVLASNLGIVAKGNESDQLTVFVQDLRSTQVLSNVEISAFDFQQQLITKSLTNAQGSCELTTDRKPHFITATKGSERGYLKLSEGMSRSLSDFDVNGVKSSAGFKGFIYGEREVWRPGDTLFLNFILGGKSYQESEKHPVTCTLYDARGQEYFTKTQALPTGPIYSFYIPTNSTDFTGNWRVEVEVGGAKFSKSLKVETVMPNRLKILYNTDEAIAGFRKKNQLELQSNWLHGAPAKNLPAKVEMQMTSASSTFQGYSKYTFTDPTRSNPGRIKTIFDGPLRSDGSATIDIPKAQNKTMPGRMKATIKTRIFEEGGAFSSDQFSATYEAFERYAGLSVPTNRWGSKRLELDVNNEVKTVLLDYKGNPVSGKRLVLGVYISEWRWWWDRSDRSIAQFSSSQHQGAFFKDTILTNNKGEAIVNIKPEQYGSYLIRVCDPESGHCSGDFYYAGRRWGGDDQGRNAAAKLVFSSDKQSYNVDKKVTLSIPSAPGAVINISLENQAGIIRHERLVADHDQTKYTFIASKQMLPNVYAHVDMIQPHNHGENDLPVRMYGIIPIAVVDESTILEPKIDMPDKLEPEQTFTISISEKNNQPMAYTIAVVDEGLLDLTRAKTPHPHQYFFAKEALGMRTWDMYDYVLNNYGGQVDRVMSVGGGVGAVNVDGVQEANRFKPVVHHLGPFYLNKGEKGQHKLQMDNYVGAVRTMVVAAGNKKYGHQEKSTLVKKPIMVLGTLPRKVSPGETFSLPVNVFAMENNIKNVTVRIKTEGQLKPIGAAEKSIRFSEIGEQLVHFTLTANDKLGQGKVVIEAMGGREEASQEINLNVINPNPFISEVINAELNSGETESFNEKTIGSQGSQEAMLEVYGIYPFSIEKRLQYLMRYPYGCLEQTTSSAFPQLYVGDLMELTDQQENRIQHNINGAITRLKRFLLPGGGLSYWPGDRHVNDWSNSYAGHFLLEAKEAGYFVDDQLLSSWKKYQKKASNSFDISSIKITDHYWGAMTQAYRLYTLAKADAPEFGAMNRLKKEIKTANTGRTLLAAAYALAGQKDVAREMLSDFEKNIPEYNQTGWTYGSGIRDRALIVEALTSMGEREQAAPILRRISEQLDRDQWMSTQSTAFSLIALSKYHNGTLDKGLNISFTSEDGNQQIIQSKKPVIQIELTPNSDGQFRFDLENMGSQTSFVRLIKRGQPKEPLKESKNSHLKMNVRYTDMAGKQIDHKRLQQGTDFIAEVIISNPGTLRRSIDEMALQQIFPSGWEVINQRMTNFENALKSSSSDYQDFRDDRVYTFFDIRKGQPLTYKVALNAAYTGRYLLPPVQCEAMYDHSISAIETGGWVEVVRSEAMVSIQ